VPGYVDGFLPNEPKPAILCAPCAGNCRWPIVRIRQPAQTRAKVFCETKPIFEQPESLEQLMNENYHLFTDGNKAEGEARLVRRWCVTEP
jgi:hypothetical protein